MWSAVNNLSLLRYVALLWQLHVSLAMGNRVVMRAGGDLDVAEGWEFRVVCRNVPQDVLISRLLRNSEEGLFDGICRRAGIDVASGGGSIGSQRSERTKRGISRGDAVDLDLLLQ